MLLEVLHEVLILHHRCPHGRELRKRGQECPLEILLRAQHVEERPARAGFGLVGFRKRGSVHENLARSDLEAAGPAHHEETLDGGLLQGGDQLSRPRR